jgi:hypothetical protein
VPRVEDEETTDVPAIQVRLDRELWDEVGAYLTHAREKLPDTTRAAVIRVLLRKALKDWRRDR